MTVRLNRYLGAALLLFAAPLLAQQPIPVRALSPAIATDSGMLMSISGVRALSGGKVLVDDVTRRRLIVLDSTLMKFTVGADTADGSKTRYGMQMTRLMRFTGDSSVMIDRESQVLVVIDPFGNTGRTMAPPKASDLLQIAGSGGAPGFDPQGRLIYRVSRRGPPGPAPASQMDGSGKVKVTPQPDSAAIVRGDFDTRSVDTIATMKIPVSKSVSISSSPGSYSVTNAINPLPSTDDWALLPDGTVAIVRVQDYHIDWRHPDGTVTSSPKMPFDWRRISLEEKVSLLDSVKHSIEESRAKAAADAAANPGVGRSGSASIQAPPVGRGGGGGVPVGAAGPVGPPPGFVRAPLMMVEPSDLPDYFPPLRQAQAKVDLEGNIWLLPATSSLSTVTQAGLVYDVVNRNGEIFERVRLPEKRTLAGFGPDGIVYLSYVPARGDARLERARIIRP